MSEAVYGFRHYNSEQFPDVRQTLLDVYEEVYADVLADPFFSLAGFSARLDRQSRSPTWRAVVGHEGAQPAGYIYGITLQRGSTWWWAGSEPELPKEFTDETGTRTTGIFEIMVRATWRKTGFSTHLHDEFLAGRVEERSTLLVEEAHPKVRAVYERWGYRSVAKLQPHAQAPRYDVMVRET